MTKVPAKLVAWKENNPERVKTNDKKRLARWRKENPEKVREQQLRHQETRKRNYDPRKRRDWQLQKTFGITLEQYEALLEAQGGGCAICETPKCSTGKAFAVDHCHDTGLVRGLLCKDCNIGLGMFKDDSKRLARALEYLA